MAAPTFAGSSPTRQNPAAAARRICSSLRTVLAGKKSAPAVLCFAPATDNVIGHGVVCRPRAKPNRAYAVELAERGYVTLAPNYPLLAKYQPDLKTLGWESGTLKAVWDNMRGLDLLASPAYVDRAKGFGTMAIPSAGTIRFHRRLRPIGSRRWFRVAGSTPFSTITKATRRIGTRKRRVPDALHAPIADYKGRLADIPFDFHEMIGALAPRHVFIIAPTKDSNFRADSVDRIVLAARPVFKLFGNEDHLRMEHPEAEHDFPPDMREAAYKLFDKVLGRE